ncbi:hypothetical protein C5167_008679 [Papaver somniferum]|uniref:Uncharacterized protein n=1 Tax=Papaver somniferum TaxID=3469 RepID=A0A4Y7JWB4_PAPSO|nr:hypothetical protein C5167_008679 [Papaver somniferum]
MENGLRTQVEMGYPAARDCELHIMYIDVILQVLCVGGGVSPDIKTNDQV